MATLASRSCWTAILLFLHFANAFYIPGWSIKSYSDGEAIPLMVNKVYSDNTQIQYAFSELPFVCPPSGRKRHGLVSGANIGLNIGEVLRGDRIMISDYELEMGRDDEAHYLCSQQVDRAGMKQAINVVKQGYVAEWIVDNLPGATSFVTVDKSKKYYAAGFKMGYEDFSPTTGKPRYFINNHVTLVIRYHTAPGRDGQRGKKVIVGFEVYAKSIEAENRDASGLPSDLHSVRTGLELTMARNTTNGTATRDLSPSYIMENFEDSEAGEDATLTIPYTYSVYFREEEKLSWSNRWDLYFVNQEDSSQIHWLAIVNSLVISGILTAVIAVILARTIRGDMKGYNQAVLEDGKLRLGSKRNKSARSPRRDGEKGGLLEQADDTSSPTALDDISDDEIGMEDITGWKLCHGDVFRPPAHGQILAPLIGSGTQLAIMMFGLLALSCFGVLNPSFRGGFVSVGVALFVVAGAFSGYFSARIYKTFGGAHWKHNAIVTATLFPGLLFGTVFLLNLFVWAQSSSTAIPLGTQILLLVLWLVIQLPLVYMGSFLGFVKSGAYTHPIKTNAVPRQIPVQPWYARNVQSVLIAGAIPFAVIFIELLFVFRSVWQDKSGYYYMFGFLGVVLAIAVVVVVETTVIGVYVMLCNENHNWHTHSFLLGASSSIWVFAYCAYYFLNHLHISGIVSTLLFFAYSFLACATYGLLMGTVEFLAAYAFVRRLYGGVKVD